MASKVEPQDLIRTLGGRKVLFVMAAEPEYGPHLRTKFEPLITGVGPVEAGVALAAVLARLEATVARPELVVSLGSAGSRSLTQTEIYQAGSVSYRDMDASALGFPRGETPFLDLPRVVPMPVTIPGIPIASLSTGANIVSGSTYDMIDADMVDMETFAVLRACQNFGLPLVGLRGISDGVAELSQVSDWTEYLHIIDEKLAAAVDRLGESLADRSILP